MKINGITKTFEEAFVNTEMRGPRLTAVWGRPVEKIGFLVGEEYTLETSTYKEEFVCKAVIDSLEGIPLDIVIMLSKERKNRKKFSLTPSDCKILNIDFEIGLEVYSTMLNWNVKEVFERYQTKMRNLNKDLTGLLIPQMGIVPFDEIQGLLDSGKRPIEVCDWVGYFKDGYARVKLNGKWNLIHREGKIQFDQWFDYLDDFQEGYAKVKLNGKYNFINKKGNILSQQWFDWVLDFEEGYASVELNGEWDLIDTEGRLYDLKKRRIIAQLA